MGEKSIYMRIICFLDSYLGVEMHINLTILPDSLICPALGQGSLAFRGACDGSCSGRGARPARCWLSQADRHVGCSACLLARACFTLEGVLGPVRVRNKGLLGTSQESLAKKEQWVFCLQPALIFFFLFLLLLCVFSKGQAFGQALQKENIKYFLFPTVTNAHSEPIYCSQSEMNSFLSLPKSSFLKSAPCSQ